MADDLDYIKAEAERLPNGTAAKFRRLFHERESFLTHETGHLMQQTPATDYIKAEAERLPNGTAARFIKALDAMDGATEPMESDSDKDVKSLDFDKDVTSGLHARSKRLERSTPDAAGQRDGKQSHVVPTFVTITISRDCAEYFAERACDNHRACFIEVGGCVALDCHLEQACRAELEGGEVNCRICGSTEHDYEFHFDETVTIALSLGDVEALGFGYVTQKVQYACTAVIEAALEGER